ncbi:Type I Iterative Polyketide synthase (PKS) [Taiwanofungus camphoratus]|nr:Type I Iterative Polyketide synthase (PKS), variant 2 [Antrodia cinnamomea]KAI0952830.1 Type I Iterative Polyketide synthase (PKS) [Antrodia cinnamomea]
MSVKRKHLRLQVPNTETRSPSQLSLLEVLTMSTRSTPIAIVGIAAELPSGTYSKTNLDYKSFFEFLLEKGEAYEKIPLERFNTYTLRGNGIGQVLTDTGAFLKDAHTFDHVEFGVSSKDARQMSLSIRRLIETTFLSLLDSGIDYRGRNIGCFMAGVAHDMFAISGHDDAATGSSFASGPSMVANRVSYHLDLRGPTIPIDTACSSSLYATHLAVQALRNGECEAAVTGACQLNYRFTEWLQYTQGGILSPDGKCKPFDASADGFGRGEAVVSIVLKPLEAALRDNDRIYATILGTGVNSSGSLAPPNAPVASAQQDAMMRAFAQTQRRPQEVDFLELHATGTAQGDPTEANWVGAEFKRDSELLIGSVKGNVGHLEITAFLASLCKVCGIFETGLIPPNVNFKRPNPAIRWKEYKFRVPTEVEPLNSPNSSKLPLVAMTSSGIGGANAHAVIEGPPPAASAPCTFWLTEAAPALLIAGGLSPRSASVVGDTLKDSISSLDNDALFRIARIHGRRSRSMTWRSFAVIADRKLLRFTDPVIVPKVAPPVVFVYSGQGPQHIDMGRQLYKTSSIFRANIQELDQVYRNVVGQSLIETTGLFKDSYEQSPLSDIWPIAITLPALTMLQLALTDTLISLGVKPDMVIGHSAGETAVLYASGAGSKAMALELSIARGQAMSFLENANGTMAAVSCSPTKASAIISDVMAELGPLSLEIGCYNTPNAITISGTAVAIDLAVRKAEAAGIFARRLRTRIPVHSSMMNLCQDQYKTMVSNVFSQYSLSSSQVETYSTLTGGLFDAVFDAQYFWDSSRGPVQFTAAMESLVAKHPNSVFVEVGPHPVLAGYVSSMAGKGATVVCPLRRTKQTEESIETYGLLETLGKLIAAGYNSVNFDVLCGAMGSNGITLSPFPLARKDVPYLAPTPEMARQRQSRNGPLNYPQLQVNSKTHPALAEHVIKGEPIMPAAGYIEMALEFGAKKLWNVEFISILALSPERPIPVHVKLEGSHWSVNSASSTDYTKSWPLKYNRLHAKGYLSITEDPRDDRLPIPLNEIKDRLKPLEMKGFYEEFTDFAFEYGPTYQRVVECRHGMDESGREEILVQVRGIDNDLPGVADYRIHPAILDAAIHALAHPVLNGNKDKNRYYLPSKLGAFIVHKPLTNNTFPHTIYTYATVTEWTPETMECDLSITDEDGVCLCSFEQLEVAIHGRTEKKLEKRYEVSYQPSRLSVDRQPIKANLAVNGSQVSGIKKSPVHSWKIQEDPSTLLIPFVRGQEMELQSLIKSLDPLAELSLCFIASTGLNGDSSLGFTRSLRKEFQSWTVRAVVFDGEWTNEEKTQVALHLTTQPDCEPEVLVKADGSVHIPRIVTSSAPVTHSLFQPDLPWKYEQSTLVQTAAPSVPKEHVLIEVIRIAKGPDKVWSFLGRTQGISGIVYGIASGSLSNIVVAHKGSVFELQHSDIEESNLGPSLLASVIAVLAIGTSSFVDPERLRDTMIVVGDSDTELGSQIMQIYKQLGLQILALPTHSSPRDLRKLFTGYPKIVLSGTQDISEVQILNDLVSQTGKLFLWNHPRQGIASTLATDPWSIGDALKCAFANNAHLMTPFQRPSDFLSPYPTEVPLVADLFNPAKSYLLVGGIGSLGVKVALWMYQRGARMVVLTSRTGRDSLAKRGEFFSQRILAYMENLPDLVLRAEAVDALSVDDTARVVKSLERPLGGCMMLSGVLVDRTFTSQSQETFEAPFVPKSHAFQVLEQVISIESLDFIIGFTSISGLLGNAGQTNYASANTALTGLLHKYKNAMALVTPGILDTRQFLLQDAFTNQRLRHISSWGMLASEFCEYIEDAILKLREGPVWQYIPDFNWRLVQAYTGSYPMYQHLVPDELTEQTDSQGDASSSLRSTVCRVLDIAPEDLMPDVPLTSYGLDSISAASMSYALRPILTVSQLQLLADLTLGDLERRLEAAAENESSGIAEQAKADVDTALQDKTREMVQLVEKYSSDLPQLKRVEFHADSAYILITGTTGTFGAHVLAQLLRTPQARKIYVFLRKNGDGTAAMERQTLAFKSRGLDISLLSSKNLVLLEGDLLQPSFGLPAPSYEELCIHVTHIIHIGWLVDWSAPLATYESAVHGLRKLVDLALTSPERRAIRLLFASTSGVFRRFDSSQPAAEAMIDDPAVAVQSGYTESKWIGERILSVAAERNVVLPTVVRIGQLTGAVNGLWKTTEWVPSLVAASYGLGCLPDGLGDVSWMPVGAGAAALADMLDSAQLVLHIRHPRPVPWAAVMGHLAAALRVSIVPYAEWVTRLERSLGAADTGTAKYVERGTRLLQWFRMAVDGGAVHRAAKEDNGLTHVLSVDEACRASRTLGDGHLPQLGQRDVETWLAYWRSVGHLPE